MLIDLRCSAPDWRHVYRLAIGFINPRPIALVSTICPDGHTNLAPFSFYNMVSGNPPVVLFCPAFRRDGGRKDTLRNIEATGQFVIATVIESIAQNMVATAADLPYGDSEFGIGKLTPIPARHVKAPLVKESPVNIECTLRQVVFTGHGPGSSAVVFGDVIAIHLDDTILDERGEIDPHKLRTVGRLGGSYYCTVTDPYVMQIPKVGDTRPG